MRLNLGLALKILALFFWWYVVVFLVSIAPLLGVNAPHLPFTEYRGESYAWDFELMFTAIFFIWGIFLWRAARNPSAHGFFIDFTITATVAHIAAMLVIGFIRTDDLWHLVKDAVALSIPLALVVYMRLRTR